MYQNENLHLTLITSRNSQLTLVTVKVESKEIPFIENSVHTVCIGENAIFVQFYVILPDIPSLYNRL